MVDSGQWPKDISEALTDDQAKQQVKNLILELIGEDDPTAGYSYAITKTKEEKLAFLRNDVRNELRQKVNEL